MAIYRKRRAYGKKRVYRKRPVRKAKTMSKKGITRIVKQVLGRQTENKLITSGLTTGLYTVASGGNFISNNIFPLSPHTEATYPAGAQLIVAQGTGDGNREGNRITTKRVMLKGVMWPNPYNATTNAINAPIEVCLWIFRLKPGYTDTYVSVQSVLANSMFKVGGSYSGLTNTMTDLTLPINTDTIILKKRRVFKLGNSSQQATVGSNNSNLYANNDFKLNQKFRMDITKYVNKKVSFKDTDNNPTSRTTWAAVSFVYSDNSTPLSGVIPASFNYFVEYQYEDL